jgi:hypothetical protein
MARDYSRWRALGTSRLRDFSLWTGWLGIDKRKPYSSDGRTATQMMQKPGLTAEAQSSESADYFLIIILFSASSASPW